MRRFGATPARGFRIVRCNASTASATGPWSPHWSRPGRRSGSHLRSAGHVWTSTEASSMTGCGRTWTRLASSGTPRSGSSTGSRMSTTPPTCPTGWCASMSPRDAARSGSKRAGNPRTRTFRRSTCQAARPRSTSARSRSGCAANWSPARCSACDSHTPARPCTGSVRPPGRKPSSRATRTRSEPSGASRPGRSATTTSRPPSRA